jgi:nitroimidazol reductase NimA-like FMN-containing flavoprotein (pyridoxamine 5'-phosphate oxidase superfamily)
MAAIVELDADECRALLSEHNFGRVGFVSDDVPVILPVNYVLDGNTIVFRTDPGLKLAEVPMRHVAFEIDAANGSDMWSVLIQGFAREITDALGTRYESYRELAIPVQAPGNKDYWVAVEIERISGRRIH